MSKAPKKPDYERLGRLLVDLYESGDFSRRQAYKMSFIKGLLGGFGGVIGATVVVALLIWLLSLISEVPLAEQLRETLQSNP